MSDIADAEPRGTMSFAARAAIAALATALATGPAACAPVTFIVLSALFGGDFAWATSGAEEASFYWPAVATAALIGGGATILIGLPAILLLRRFGRVAWHDLMNLGALTGAALAPPLLGLGWRGVAIGALYGAVYGALLSLPLARLGAK